MNRLVNFITRVAHPPEKPLLIFDGDCTFCRRWIARWKQMTGERVEYTTLQSDEIALRFPELLRPQLETAVHFIQPDGQVTHGAEAVFRTLAVAQRWPLRLYQSVPGFAPVSEVAYRLVAANRMFFSLLTRALWGNHVEVPTHFLVRWLFLRLLAVTYLIAFLSLNSQLSGLIGRNGIVPAQSIMTAVKADYAGNALEGFHLMPTLCWFGADDGFLRTLGHLGVALSALLLLGIAPAPCLFLLWLIYLSLAQVSTVFLGYQWDNLLLETGFLAIFFAPLRLWPNLTRERPPSAAVLWLLRWLLFRLMFSSGIVKLLSGDVTWHNLTALTFHYETQPLPTVLAWYAHQWPVGIHKAVCGLMFFIEIVLPFFIFLPRRPRFVAFWAFIVFMLGIALTGNYTFFNLLTCVLCLPLLDDFALLRFAPSSWAGRVLAGPRPSWLRPLPTALCWSRNVGLMLVVVVILGVSTVEMTSLTRVQWTSENLLVRLYRWAAPFRSINGYGLFAIMTTTRPEIIVEGSRDGTTWLAYEFRDKPGDLRRRPTFVAPHQPRLDWQMWFAALGQVRANPWFENFCFRLLQGKPEVLALLEKNPFHDAPPQFIRASLYDYHFTTPEERRKDGSWWRRVYRGEYCPALSLRGSSQKEQSK